MFFETATHLASATDQREINILLDAFAIHTRNLFEFLYPKQGKSATGKPPKPTDILATDYIERRSYYRNARTPKKDLEFVWKKASKQVAHLTYTRNTYSTSTKPWYFADITTKMHRTLKAFYDSLPEKYKNWEFFKALLELL